MSAAAEISVVLTVRNEARGIVALLEGLEAQSTAPREAILVDGGSNDDTVALIESRRAALRRRGIELVVEVVPGAGISRGRNAGVERAACAWIATLDGGVVPRPDWVRAMVAAFEEGADLVGGVAVSETSGTKETAIARILFPRRHPAGFLPSSRSFGFRKAIWEQVGGYPEALPWGEDTRFVRQCLESGARLVQAEDAVVVWDGRREVRALLKQQYRYGVGDGMARHFSASNLLAVGVILVTGAAVALPVEGGALLLVLLAFYAVRRKYGFDLAGVLAAVLTFPATIARGLGFLRGLTKGAAR